MKLRIKSGTLGRRLITIKSSRVNFRPTLERVRQSVVDSIDYCITDAVAADVCAGSGAVGFEFLSRGARTVHFVEKDRFLTRSIKDHIRLFDVEKRAKVIQQDIHQYIKTTSPLYDILFFDPPYHDEGLNQLIPHLMRLVRSNGILIYQHDRSVPFEMPENSGLCFSCRKYGRTLVEYIRHSSCGD